MTIAVVRRTPSNTITMEGSASSINSRATAIKTILLAAWRGKLTNDEWELRIRKVLPRGVNGDVYDLADCLLKQALIGPVPNQLFLNYLKHAVSCELVSHAAVLSSISNQPINLRITSTLLHRTSPIICILEFLKAFRDKISCKGNEVECLNLCHSSSELINWLLKCIQQTLEFITTNPPAASSLQQIASTNSSTGIGNNPSITGSNVQYNSQTDTLMSILDLCTETIHYFINCPFTKSLLFIDKLEHPNEFDENILKLVHIILQKLASNQSLQILNDRVAHLSTLQQLNVTFVSRDLHPSVIAAQQLRCLQSHKIRSTQITSASNFERNRVQISPMASQTPDSNINHVLFNSLYPLVAFDAILKPARLNKHLARQIVTITNFNLAPVHTTYCELIRICMIGLIEAHGNSKAKETWSFFTFLKLPRLLLELNRMFDRHQRQQLNQAPSQQSHNSSAAANPLNFINDLKQAFERLCEYSPLLDEAEFKCNCDLFKCLIKELIKNDQGLIQIKNLDFKKFTTRRPVNSATQNTLSGGYMMLKTEPVVTHMLNAMSSEQDPVELFSILCQACASFEYTLSAAAATGRLHLFVKRLVDNNELYKVPRGNLTPRHCQAQACNFDITFLMLIYIAQRYGPELIEKEPSAFNRWYCDCYNRDTCSNCPKEMLKNCNDDVVSSLIKQLLDPDQDIQLQSVDWNMVCFSIPKVINEILNAWVQDQITDEDIALVIERLRSKMCFMAVVASNWLHCHIRTLDDSMKIKPLYMLNNLGKASQLAKQQKISSSETIGDQMTELDTWGYHNRSGFMCAIIRRIHFELAPNRLPPTSTTSSITNGSSTTKLQGTGGSGGSNSNTIKSGVESDDSQDEQSYHSYKDRFMSTLTTKEIFMANVKQCLSRGWIDYNSLNSISSLFKIIGSECFTSLIVDEILTSHESPSDLGRSVNISFGLFHLDIEACAFALLDHVIPSWLMSEKKQKLLNQPRAFALANLAVMTIIEVYNNLMASQATDGIIANNSNANTNNNNHILNNESNRKFSMNGIRPDHKDSNSISMIVDSLETSQAMNGPGDNVKRIKLMSQDGADSNKLKRDSNFRMNSDEESKNIGESLDKLNGSVANLMGLFKEIMADSVMSHRTLFPILFLQQTVVCAREVSAVVTVHLQPEILLDIIDLFSSELTFELVLAISNLSTTQSRKYTAKSVCKLAQLVKSGQVGGGMVANQSGIGANNHGTSEASDVFRV